MGFTNFKIHYLIFIHLFSLLVIHSFSQYLLYWLNIYFGIVFQLYSYLQRGILDIDKLQIYLLCLFVWFCQYAETAEPMRPKLCVEPQGTFIDYQKWKKIASTNFEYFWKSTNKTKKSTKKNPRKKHIKILEMMYKEKNSYRLNN